MDDEAVEVNLTRLLAKPDPLVQVTQAAAQAGEWRLWTFGRQLWFLRERGCLTQMELARRSGVSQNRISLIESGDDVKLSTLRALWRALGYEPMVVPDSIDLVRSPRPE